MDKKTNVWLHSLLASLISGWAGGIVTAFAAIGIFPDKFNLAAGFGATLKLALVSAVLHAVLGLAMFLQKSPLPDKIEG